LGHQVTYALDQGIREWIDLVRAGRRTESPGFTAIPIDIPTLRGRKGS